MKKLVLILVAQFLWSSALLFGQMQQMLINPSLAAPAVSPPNFTNGLVAWWPLAGDFIDHWSTNNGTGFNTPTSTVGPGGQNDTAYYFSGSDWIITTDLGGFGSSMMAGFSMTAWVKSNYSNNVECIMGSDVGYGNPGNRCMLYVNYDSFLVPAVGPGRIEFVVRGASGSGQCVADYPSDSGICDGNWHFIAAIMNPVSNTAHIYLDNVALTISIPLSGATGAASLVQPMGLGQRVNQNDMQWRGFLAGLRVFAIELTAPNVNTLYTNGTIYHTY